MKEAQRPDDAVHEARQLRERLAEAEEVIRALRAGEADALVVSGANGPKVYTLEGAEHPYRILIETMNEGATTLHGTGTVLYANARFAEIIGTPLSEIIGQPFLRFVAPADKSVFEGLFRSGLSDRSIGTLMIMTPMGVNVPVQISMRALDDRSAAQTCMIVTDMSASYAAATQLRKALADKELLLREVHHRVKNNLQVITSLLRLQARAVGDAHISETLLESQNRIQIMALVHEQLYRSADLTAIDIGDYLRSIATRIYRSYTDQTSRLRLQCDVLAQLELNPDLAIPLGLIANELLINCIKHAFPNGRTGVIHLQASIDQNHLIFVVADNGIGFTPPVGPTTTLGLELVTSLTRQIKGSLHIDGTNGTRTELRIPLNDILAPETTQLST